jgi:acyl-CoA synthetase (AMP-forming)/AMP-acid ligase II
METFYQLFRECAERWPDNVALEIQRRNQVESNTYAEVRRMAESIGRWLTESGFQQGARIAISRPDAPPFPWTLRFTPIKLRNFCATAAARF